MPQIVRIVTRPGGSTVLDLSPGTAGAVLGDGGLKAPPPPVDLNLSQSPVRDGGVVSAAPFGLRTVTMNLVYTAGTTTAAATAAANRKATLQALYRAITQDRWWLEVRADGATESRFLWCYKASDPNLLAALDGLGEAWIETRVEVQADPFALGLRETLAALTHNVAGGFRQTIAGAGIKGDVPSPVEVAITSVAGEAWTRTVWMASKVGGIQNAVLREFQTLANGTPPAGSTFTAGSTGDATRSISGNADLWTVVDAGMTMAVGDGNIVVSTAGGNGQLQGAYRVFLMTPALAIAGLTAGSRLNEIFDYDLRLISPPALAGVVSEIPVGTKARHAVTTTDGALPPGDIVDLGVIEVPFGRPASLGHEAAVDTVVVPMRVYATYVSGPTDAGRAFDALMVLPADDTFMTMTWVQTSAVRVFTADPVTESVVVREAGLNAGDAARASYQGSTPYVVPGVDVGVAAFAARGGAGAFNPIYLTPADLALTWTPAYYPRYLSVI